MLFDEYEQQNANLTNFAMNFGLAWHFISRFKEQYEIWIKLKQYKPYAMVSFLEEAKSRYKMNTKEDTLKYIAEAHIVEAETHLAKLVGNEEIAREFIEQQLMQITEINKIELLPKLKF